MHTVSENVLASGDEKGEMKVNNLYHTLITLITQPKLVGQSDKRIVGESYLLVFIITIQIVNFKFKGRRQE